VPRGSAPGVECAATQKAVVAWEWECGQPTRKLLALLYGCRAWLLKQQWFTSRLLAALPRSLRWTLRKLYFLPSDLIERVLNDRDELVPPRSSIFTGSVDDFRSGGEALVRLLPILGV